MRELADTAAQEKAKAAAELINITRQNNELTTGLAGVNKKNASLASEIYRILDERDETYKSLQASTACAAMSWSASHDTHLVALTEIGEAPPAAARQLGASTSQSYGGRDPQQHTTSAWCLAQPCSARNTPLGSSCPNPPPYMSWQAVAKQQNVQAAERKVAELSAQCTELEADHSQFEADFGHLREDIEHCTALQVPPTSDLYLS